MKTNGLSEFAVGIQGILAAVNQAHATTSEVTLSEYDFRGFVNTDLDDKRKQLATAPNKERRLEVQLQCAKESLSGYRDIIDAKTQVAGIVDQLITDMSGKPVRRLLKASEDDNGIAYNLLPALASMDACDPAKVANALSNGPGRDSRLDATQSP